MVIYYFTKSTTEELKSPGIMQLQLMHHMMNCECSFYCCLIAKLLSGELTCIVISCVIYDFVEHMTDNKPVMLHADVLYDVNSLKTQNYAIDNTKTRKLWSTKFCVKYNFKVLFQIL